MAHAGDHLSKGTPVEVKNGYGLQFAPGFEVSATTPEGYRLRRLSDGAVLPATFPEESVRRAPAFSR